jgi:hypothetical protein
MQTLHPDQGEGLKLKKGKCCEHFPPDQFRLNNLFLSEKRLFFT